MRALVKSSRAELDLVQIWARLSTHGERVAERAMALIERRCELIQQFPHGGEACPRFGNEMRWIPAGNYMIFYRPQDDRVQVVRVIDARRDLDRAFWHD
jgi:toxin ParE1/3/4